MRTESLFSVPLAISVLDRELTEKETDFIVLQDNYQNQGNKTTYNKQVLNAPELCLLKDFIEQEIKTYSDSVMCYTDIELYITQSWINYNNPKEFHHQH